MLKRVLALVMAWMLCISFAACEGDAETDIGEKTAKTPEEVAEDFIRVMYYGDLDGFFALIPEYTYDVLIEKENMEIPEGKDKADVVYDFFADVMEQEPEEIATDVQVETKISDTLTRENYLEAVRKYYIPEGFVTEEDLEKLEDVVYVAFNSEVTYPNGETTSLTDFEAALPCVKVDGQWYVDYLYLIYIPVQAKVTTAQVAQ